MNTLSHLFKDSLFLAALIVFLISLGVFVRISIALWALLKGRKSLFREESWRPIPSSAEIPEDFPAASSTSDAGMAPVPPSASRSLETEPMIMFSVMEEKVSELSRRISSLETQRPSTPAVSTISLDPLIKRLKGIEDDLDNLKRYISQMNVSQNKPSENFTAISERVDGLQRILESLTGESEVSKFP
jgi:hypothetical protein